MTRVIQAGEWHASLVGQTLNLMRESGVLCDIIIQSCEGREFLAHGCILAAASPILKAAIGNTIGELSTLRMEWLSGSVLETLLNFIYTGELKVYSGDTAMVSNFFYAVEQLEMEGVLVTCKDEGSADTCTSATDMKAARNAKGSVANHAAKHSEFASANKGEASSANKGEVSSVNKDEVSSADKAIVSSINKTEVTYAKKAVVSSENKAESSSGDKGGIAATNKTEVSSGSKDKVSTINKDVSKSLPESSKSEEGGADHSYADANSGDRQCAEPSLCETSARPWSAKYNRKSRLWGCPAPMMLSRKNYLTRPYSLKCPICQKCFSNSLALANHRLMDAPLSVFRVWHGKLEEVNDNLESDKATVPTEDEPTTSGVQAATDTVTPETKSDVKPTTKGMFACPQCGKEFKKKIELKNHSKVHMPPLTCPVCSRTCKSRSKLRRHHLSHTREKPYVCKVCDKSFQLNESLVIHSRLHTGERPFKCCICNQGFRDKSVLRNHELKHTGAKPFQCAQCGRQYGSRNALSRHRNVHTLERCYQCEHCARVFYQLSGLMCHRRTHTGEKPYICSICSRAFGDRSSMRRHERVHTGERPYTCPTCNKTFTQSSSLKSHQKTHVKHDMTKIICVEVHPPQIHTAATEPMSTSLAVG